MTGALMSVQSLRDDVARSRGHIVKQDAIIARFRELGNAVLAAEASAILVTMREHLAIEVSMLARREAENSTELESPCRSKREPALSRRDHRL